MIGWLIIIVCSFVLVGIFGMLAHKSLSSDSAWEIPTTIFAFLGAIFLFIALAASLIETNHTRIFMVDKAYYQIYNALPENGWRDEDYAVEDANEWLMYAKVSRETLGIFSLYPVTVEKLEPIK